MLTRKAFLGELGAALVAISGSSFLDSFAGRPASAMSPPDLSDPVRALLAFVVPGSDAYSVAQGVSTPEPGGVDAGVVDSFVATLDLVSPTPPGFPSTSAFVFWLLDQYAFAVSGGRSDFAGLVYAQKMALFAVMETDPLAGPLAAAIITLAASGAYSEAGVFDPVTRTLSGTPQGWVLTGYPGVADGRDEFVGYYHGRRKASP